MRPEIFAIVRVSSDAFGACGMGSLRRFFISGQPVPMRPGQDGKSKKNSSHAPSTFCWSDMQFLFAYLLVCLLTCH
jgi:hypothetical protein